MRTESRVRFTGSVVLYCIVYCKQFIKCDLSNILPCSMPYVFHYTDMKGFLITQYLVKSDYYYSTHHDLCLNYNCTLSLVSFL